MRTRPPVGSRPIDQTDWSGDHHAIKEYLGLGPTHRGNVWAQESDRNWRNYGPAADYPAQEERQVDEGGIENVGVRWPMTELDEMGTSTALYLQLPGSSSNGACIDWEALKKFADIRITFELEVFPKMRPD